MATPTHIVNPPKMLPEAYVETNELAKNFAEKYQDLRLRALKVAPEAFASSYQQEVERGPRQFLDRLKAPEADQFFAVDRDIVEPAESVELFYRSLLEAEFLGMIVLLGPVFRADIMASKDPSASTQGKEAGGGENGSHPKDTTLHFQLNGTFVDPKCRRSGLGVALLKAALEKGKAKTERQNCAFGCSVLVDSENNQARKLYEKASFVVVGEEKYHQQPRTLMGEEKGAERVALRMELQDV